MVKIGDWIEMPSNLANGTVTEINLTTVKVQNGDKTITNIPIYSLISESFINWKGLEESGVRRIRRSINIDMNSVKICDNMLLEKLKRFDLITDYIQNIFLKINNSNSDPKGENKFLFNENSTTNITIFRKYLEAYLNNNSMINKELSIVVRHLQPTENGIPIEISAFCNEIQWPQYEAIQSDLFDHILAVIPEFELRVFQYPSGTDIKTLLPFIRSKDSVN